jgi:transposase
MFSLNEQTRVLLKPGITDGRLGAQGLIGLVSQMDGQDVFSGSLFIFCNRRRNRVSCLLWDGSGIWLARKYLQKGTFDFPMDAGEVSQMSLAQLRMLLEGFELKSRRGWQRYEGRLPPGRTTPEQLAAAQGR